jgi:glycosyltransferase involved in cell wall biosynthesis
MFDLAIPLIGFNPSGGVRMVIHVANALAARGRHVAFVVPRHAATPPIDLDSRINVEIRGNARQLGDRVAFCSHLPKARVYLATGYQTPLLISWGLRLKNRDAHIVHLLQADEATTHIRYGSQPIWARPVLRWIASSGLRVPATRIAVSQAVADAVGRERVQRVINPGIEARYIARARDETPIRRSRRNDATDVITAGFFAQAGLVKGTAVMIAALERIPPPTETIRFVAFDRPGAPPLPDYVERFSVLQAERPVDLMAFYSTCDVFVFPSLAEGFGLPPLEAMACGAATVITDCGGVREYARDGINCLLVPPGDADALAAALQRLLEDGGLRAGLVAAGLETAVRFPVERFASECADEIERVARAQDDRAA